MGPESRFSDSSWHVFSCCAKKKLISEEQKMQVVGTLENVVRKIPGYLCLSKGRQTFATSQGFLWKWYGRC